MKLPDVVGKRCGKGRYISLQQICIIQKKEAPKKKEAESWMEKHLDKSYIEEISWKNAEQMLIRS